MQEVYHYTVRPIEGERYECMVEELGQKVIADTPEAALHEGQHLVAVMLYEAALREKTEAAKASA